MARRGRRTSDPASTTPDAQATLPDPDTFTQSPQREPDQLHVFYGTTQLWEQVANALLAQIASGRYPIGARLPSIRQLRDEHGIADGTAQRALRALADSGIARPADRSGYYVTAIPAQPPAPPTGTTSAYSAVPASPSEFAPSFLARPLSVIPIDAEPPPALTVLAHLTVARETAPPDIAQALHITDPTASVIVRRRLLTDTDATPTEFRVSYLAADAAEGTPLQHSVPITQPWADALAMHSRRAPAQAHTRINARRPTDHEAATLRLAPTAITITRDTVTVDQQGQPIDLTRSIWPAETTTITHTVTNLTP